ncbi:hypothetical protein [Halobacillus massiliensis]|uniref:hypothetical protein n=1 Tax=Halobacillus massiliensis TaxID=1926286 RepID=UPI0009E3C98D|nr:hypothetical protein [Halobacillus massiliensis]
MNLSTWEVYRWVRGQRIKKKFDLYKQGFRLVFDWTVFIYMVVFGMVFLIMLADWLTHFLPVIASWEMRVEQWLWILPSALLVKAVLQSFTHSGLTFTSSELKLSMLPHTRKDMLWHMALVYGFWQLLAVFGLAAIIGIMTPFTNSFTFRMAAVYFLFFTLTIVVQWKLYSVSKWKKLLWVVFILAFVAGMRGMTESFQWDKAWIGLCLGLILLAVNVYLLPRLLHGVNWGRVVEVNDARVWNIRLISQMTSVNIRPPKRYGIVQTYFRSRSAKQRFTTIYQLYHRMWRRYFLQNFGYIWKTMGICLLVIGLFPHQASWLIYFACPIALFVYVEISGSLFINHFTEHPLLSVVPIEEKGWQESYFRWGAWGLVPLLFVFFITGWSIKEISLFLIIQTGCMAVWGLIDLKQILLIRTQIYLRKRTRQQNWLRLFGYLVIGAGIYFPPALLGLLVPFYVNRQIHLLFLRPKV